MWDDLPDETLMQCVVANDAAAFDVLFRRHRRTVFSYTLRMVGDHQTAEDLTQEAFLRVWRARQQYQPMAAFRTWLFTIARRLTLDEFKRQQRHPVALVADTAADEHLVGWDRSAPAGRENPHEILVTRDLARVLDQALRSLPEDLREAALLRDVEGLSYDEIAQVLGCPLGTVKSRLNSARRRLQAVAREWLGEKTT